MTILILVFAALIVLAGVIIIVNPAIVPGPLKTYSERVELHIAAVVVRLFFGTLLIYLADASRFPVAIRVLGWITVIAAVVFAVIGRQRFIRLLNMSISMLQSYARLIGFIALALGGFVVYAFA